jgi:hypothetical protein
VNAQLLAAALEGLEAQRQRIEAQIREVRSMLRRPGRPAAASANNQPSGAGGRRALSPAARRRIAAAQKRRWAAYRKHRAAESKK